MEKDDQIWKEVEKTMQSLDGMNRAEAPPSFFGRLQERLETPDKEERSIRLIWSIAAVMLLIIVNIFVVSQVNSDLATDEGVNTFMDEYVLSAPLLYEPETQEAD